MKKSLILLLLCFFVSGLVSCSGLQDAGADSGFIGESGSDADSGVLVASGSDSGGAAVSGGAVVDYDELLEDMEQAAVANPWGDTQALSVAEEYSGVHFDTPEESCLPEGLSLETYRYTDQIIEARYTGGDNELVIRKSDTVKGRELSGDHNRYADEQVFMIQGMAVTFCGDGQLTNLAFYEDENGNFAISYNAGEEGRGLTEKEIQKLIEREAGASSSAGSSTEAGASSEAGVISSGFRFRTPELLMSHFTKHGIDMGFTTPEAYEEAASRVVTNPRALHKTEAEDGDDVYYVEDTNEFVVMSRDGYIRTYFNPDRGKAYFDKQ
ncbi:MAG: hypothetical protein K6C95_11410 [Lachnospiraceae bacterium]|nr:hypothetical protein [Lachnospiraceae bacterium]